MLHWSCTSDAPSAVRIQIEMNLETRKPGEIFGREFELGKEESRKKSA
jgi:hypothetical protein